METMLDFMPNFQSEEVTNKEEFWIEFGIRNRRKFDRKSSVYFDIQKYPLESDFRRSGDVLGGLWGTFWSSLGPPERTLSAQKRLSGGSRLGLVRTKVPKDAQERPRGL